MNDVEEQLTAAGRSLRSEAEVGTDPDAALADVLGRAHRRRAPVIVAAAAAVVGLVVGGAVLLRDDDRQFVTTADDGSSAVPSTTSMEPTTTVASPATDTPATDTPGSTGLPDLQRPEPGREITFTGVGDVSLGQGLDPATVTVHEGTSCGYWGPAEPSHDGDEPLGGLAAAANTDLPMVSTVHVSANPTYRTASGVGVGTTLASLQRVYGDDLVVDRADGWQNPTDGLLASYQDVAAVWNGETALTFLLRDDIVERVKLSDAAFWGDDEGCA